MERTPTDKSPPVDKKAGLDSKGTGRYDVRMGFLLFFVVFIGSFCGLGWLSGVTASW
jgi:hypothetical protein